MDLPDSSPLQLLSSLDAENLLAAGLIGPVTPAGTRRVHKRRLDPFSDKEYEHIPLCDVNTPQADSLEAYAEIPNDLISEATLRYIGYDAGFASYLWNQWRNRRPGHPAREGDDREDGMPFIVFATGHVEGRVNEDISDENDYAPWFRCLEACHIDSSTTDAIMDPHFRDARCSESCLFLIKDTMEMRYRGLETISVPRASALCH